jgi:hypothetical protein
VLGDAATPDTRDVTASAAEAANTLRVFGNATPSVGTSRRRASAVLARRPESMRAAAAGDRDLRKS